MTKVISKDMGAHFYRCDFQVHSPRDLKWVGTHHTEDDDRISYAVKLITACRKTSLDAIAVTDHHDMVFVDYIRQAAEQEVDSEGNFLPKEDRIIVFPGIELTLAVPCQAILLLDADFESSRFESLLDVLAISPSSREQKTTAEITRLGNIESLRKLKSKLDEHPWLEGRYIIFPNVSGEGKDSLLRSGMMQRYKDMPFVGGYLDGSKGDLKHGTLSIIEGKDNSWGNKRIACIQTSDNRREDHAELGKHSSWIKWANPTAEALRQACLAQESRISDSKPALPSVVITSVSAKNSSFLGPLYLRMNPQFNAVIGGRGTGKSTILEYIRWALCDQPPTVQDEDVPNYQSRRKRLIEGTLKPHGATVDVAFTVNGVTHEVRRTSIDNSVQIKVGDDEFRVCTESEVRSLLPIQAYSQKQLSNVSVRLDELMRFVASPIHAELAKIERQETEQKTRIQSAFSSHSRRIVVTKNISRLTLEIRSLQKQIKGIKSSLEGVADADQVLFSHFPYYQQADQVIDVANSRLSNATSHISRLIGALTPMEINDPQTLPDDFPEQLLLSKITDNYNFMLSEIKNLLTNISGRIENALSDSEHAEYNWPEWKIRFSAFLEAHSAALERSSELNSRTQQLTELETKAAALQRELSGLKDELDSIHQSSEIFQAEQENLYDLRLQRDTLIQKQCDILMESSANTIRAKLQRYSNSQDFLTAFRAKISGSNLRTKKIEQLIQFIFEAADRHIAWKNIIHDLEHLANFNPDEESIDQIPETKFLTLAGMSKDDCLKLSHKISADDWLSLSLIEITSEPRFEYRSREGEYISFSNASSGQQATALLRALLNQHGGPLLIDQPEEDLDNPIMQQIVEQIWSAKKSRQIIFVSHNANIVVNGDAELVIWCEHRKAGDQSGGKIAGEGAIDIPDVKEAIKRIMEGGEAAFNLRREKYGF